MDAKPDILVHGNNCATFLEAFTQQLFQSDDKQMVFLIRMMKKTSRDDNYDHDCRKFITTAPERRYKW